MNDLPIDVTGSRIRARTLPERRVVEIRIDHGRANPLDAQAYAELLETYDRVSRADDIAAVFLAGNDRCFSAGQDISEAEHIARDPQAYLLAAASAISAATRCPVPVVAAVRGAAIGAGLILALTADVIVIDEGAQLRLPEAEVGVIAGYAHLSARIGRPAARRAVLTGRRIDPAQFAAAGAILAPHGEVETRAWEEIDRFTAIDPAVLRATKHGWQHEHDAVADAYEAEIRRTIDLGLMRFRQTRP